MSDVAAPATEVKDVKKVRLTSSDNEDFIIERDVALKSVLIKNMLEDVDGNEEDAIPLPNVNAAVLKKVLAWCEHHKSDPEPFVDAFDEDRRRNIEITPWDREFYNVDQSEIFDIVLAANYLDIKQLLEVGCKTIANMIKGKTPEQIRELFGIENDFTPEEEAQIRIENEWAEDR